MTLCFGTFARVLNLCKPGKNNPSQRELINALLSTVYDLYVSSGIQDTDSTKLLNCTQSISPAVRNAARQLISEGKIDDIVSVFDKKVIKTKCIKTDEKTKLSIERAIKDILGRDSIDENETVDIVNDKKKKALLAKQGEDDFERFLTGVFLYTVLNVDNNINKSAKSEDDVAGVRLITKEYIDAFSTETDSSLSAVPVTDDVEKTVFEIKTEDDIKKFYVALSFAGENRPDFVRPLANELSKLLPKEKILFDEFHPDLFGESNTDLVLGNAYRNESELVVIFMCKRYEEKPWTINEWRAIRDLLNTPSARGRIVFISINGHTVDGFRPNVDTYYSAEEYKDKPDELARLIVRKLERLSRHPIRIAEASTKNVADEAKPLKGAVASPATNEHQLGEEYYNLIVNWLYEPDDCWLYKDRVVMPRDRALEGYVADDVYALFGDISDKATVERIKQLPTIFACESRLHEYPEQEAYYGFVTDIKVRDNGINIYFRKVGQLSQKKLAGIAYNLAIKTNEFTHSHWTIKKVNLIEELNDAELMDNLKVRFKPATKSGKIIMTQYGTGGQQIGSISGGSHTFNLGGNSSNISKGQSNNSTVSMIEIFRKAIIEFKIVKFLKADPTCSLSADLPTCVDGFVEYIEEEIIQAFIHCQRNITYKKIREFNKAVDSYNAYLSTHMRPPNSDSTSIFVPLFREENYEWAAEFDDETMKRRRVIDAIYGEILDGETLFV